MTRFLLDTDALVDFSKGREPAYSSIMGWIDAGDTVGSCAITVAEFLSGLTPQEAQDWSEFVSSLTYWDISVDDAVRAGQERYAFARQGRSLSVADVLIAAATREQGATLVTGNVGDYPMQGITLCSLSRET
ncbi:MAG: PIN domain-containing protein [Chloroflexi bacterium]|nr:PIN domain-containing protein [Chloroflexota bacterium]